MGYTHVAHDCVVGNHIIMANGSGLAGHCSVDDFANIGGFVGIQQKARLGSYCFLAGGTLMRRDLAPFMAARGESEVVGPNLVGLRRAGFDQQQTRVIREIFKIFYNKTLTAELALKKISEEFSNSPQAKLFLDFTAKTVIGVQR
jgi:UDP-N-acetylglucosamine acyltransferase